MIDISRVPAIDGRPLVGTAKLISGMSISATEAVVQIEGALQAGWTELTEAEYLALVPLAIVAEPEPTEIQVLLEKVTSMETTIQTIQGDIATIKETTTV